MTQYINAFGNHLPQAHKHYANLDLASGLACPPSSILGF